MFQVQYYPLVMYIYTIQLHNATIHVTKNMFKGILYVIYIHRTFSFIWYFWRCLKHENGHYKALDVSLQLFKYLKVSWKKKKSVDGNTLVATDLLLMQHFKSNVVWAKGPFVNYFFKDSKFARGLLKIILIISVTNNTCYNWPIGSKTGSHTMVIK